jgi:hypothetical protein
MAHELRALITRAGAVHDSRNLAVVPRPQEFVLIPITDELFDQLDGGQEKVYADQFWFLSGGVHDLAVQLSRTAPVAYIEVEFFGGVGTQASIAWRDGAVISGPTKHEFEYGADEPPRERWPVNAALAAIGATPGNSIDEFDGLRLGQRRHTERWLDPDR